MLLKNAADDMRIHRWRRGQGSGPSARRWASMWMMLPFMGAVMSQGVGKVGLGGWLGE